MKGLDDQGKIFFSSKIKSATKSIVQRGGIIFFWVLNDDCDRRKLSLQLAAFQKAGVEGLVLHPRSGLLLPYGGEDWFQLIRWLVTECRRRGIEPILYDEDPYPSGNAGGRIVAEHPQYQAYGIECIEADESLKEGDLFLFPTGRLCWAGVVFPKKPAQESVDLTARVGMIRRYWEKAEWNSQWYYPDTPLYAHPRAFAHHPEFGLRCPQLPPGGKLIAFVARPVQTANEWGSLVDTLNPKATRLYLEYTHEQYRKSLENLFGKEVSSIFTDESKPPASYPWTQDLFEDFERTYHYDLRPRLHLLFAQGVTPQGMQVRTDYREWITRRFSNAWMQPIAQWCKRHGLSLIGHLSPEEDPVNQAATLGNIFPLQKSLTLSGYDLIIPAIGDAEHPLLNIGPLIATSIAQQNQKPGVCCESLGAFGVDVQPPVIAKTLAWHILHGATLGVIHGAFSSQLGLRRYEAPDDYGVNSPQWDSIVKIRQKLDPFFKVNAHATQKAPVAILWPIRSFQASGAVWQHKDRALRHDLLRLTQCCLENQIGIHFIDEEDLASATFKNNELIIGKASYQWILIPSLTLIAETTQKILTQFSTSGIPIHGIGKAPQWIRAADTKILPAYLPTWKWHSFETFRKDILPLLPSLLSLPKSLKKDFHATGWKSKGQERIFLMHTGKKAHILPIEEMHIPMQPGDLLWLQKKQKSWEVYAHFSPSTYPHSPEPAARATYQEWDMELSDGTSVTLPHPVGVWQLIRTFGPQTIHTIVTKPAIIGGGKMVDSVSYKTQVQFSGTFAKIFFRIEPTLMSGRFTLTIGKHQWHFQVADTDIQEQQIDLSKVVQPGQTIDLQITLHEPEAMDGIKHPPHFAFR